MSVDRRRLEAGGPSSDFQRRTVKSFCTVTGDCLHFVVGFLPGIPITYGHGAKSSQQEYLCELAERLSVSRLSPSTLFHTKILSANSTSNCCFLSFDQPKP
jgi:hypothetical protein